ncbi:mannose-P-dolichol utilization defect 1 protein [Aplysia californica]|uniref:Mannose-P-dolichol utilization defect 1 protein homolog n=1 Tax=Aplysia californica TaxID=6500 RepID=A0ABM1ACW4_APLCA|nr:mannose-P-dolichol utilization defect 1 protein [Aplysia californica]
MVANSTIIPAFLVGWIQIVVPGDCFDEFFVKFNFLHVPCLKITISKCLGFAIILGSSIVKLPQVIKIFKAKSGQGISLVSVTFELMAISASWAYGAGNNFPFSSYGEAIFLAIQTGSIAFMILFFSGKHMHAVAYMSIFVGSMAFLLSPAAPKELLATLQAGNLFMVVASKMLQAVANVRNGGTGQLSFVTFLLLSLGAVARVFTSIQETGDSMVVASYVLASVMNGLILGQILYYWNVPPPVVVEAKKVK